jgi:predicted GTPase
MSKVKNVLIMGAAGRDFHNFNTYFRKNPDARVVAFTAHQIPGIAGRTYPPDLSGPLYPEGIPIFDESELPGLIESLEVEDVVFSYSDVNYLDVMHKASLVNSCGANFCMLGTAGTEIASTKPLLSVCAVRTGCGKSQTSRRITEILNAKGKKVVAIRHPMPYGDLSAQKCQRFAVLSDLDKHKCTIEEREEYEGHIRMGNVIYAGVDYEEILRSAEKEADIILWDGGNNDTPFYKSDLQIVLVDPHRPGHEVRYYPGETNLRVADIVVIPKTGTAKPENIAAVKKTASEINPSARIIEADSVVSVADPSMIKGKKVLVVEDGPTLTHGEMSYGAGHVAAVKFGAAEIIDPRPYAVGTIKATFEKFGQVRDVLPAMGYGDEQVRELQDTINAVPCDVVLVGTPFDLAGMIESNKPLVRVTYDLDEPGTAAIKAELEAFLVKHQ